MRNMGDNGSIFNGSQWPPSPFKFQTGSPIADDWGEEGRVKEERGRI